MRVWVRRDCGEGVGNNLHWHGSVHPHIGLLITLIQGLASSTAQAADAAAAAAIAQATEETKRQAARFPSAGAAKARARVK